MRISPLFIIPLLAVAVSAADAGAQYRQAAERAPTTLRVRSRALAQGGYAVVVNLDENRLYFAKGRRVLWSAPVGTGTGLRLETDRDAYEFHTPAGVFHVTHKAREPDWIAPDWYFVEHGMRVPGPNDPRRRFTRGLGAAAVYIGQGLAIHGTDKPELLGRRVSHGCIRLSDANALRLYHDVQPGTEVVIVGGGDVEDEGPSPTVRRTRPEGAPPPRDPFVVELEKQSTDELLARLDDELGASASEDSEWPRVASVLIFRGVKEDDDAALAGVLSRIAGMREGRLRDEYSAYVADAYTQGALRTLSAMGQLERATRAEVARAIVGAAVGLYPGRPEDPSTPWPTKRAPRSVLEDRDSQRAWDTLLAAEQDFREQRGLAMGPTR